MLMFLAGLLVGLALAGAGLVAMLWDAFSRVGGDDWSERG